MTLRLDIFDPISAATRNMDKSLKAAHMTSTDYRVAARLTEAEMQLASFLEMLQGPHPEDFEQQLAKIEGFITTGFPLV